MELSPSIEKYAKSVTDHKQVVSPHIKLFPNSFVKTLGGKKNVLKAENSIVEYMKYQLSQLLQAFAPKEAPERARQLHTASHYSPNIFVQNIWWVS